MRVLLVDDSPHCLRGRSANLRKIFQLEVVPSQSGAEALTLLERRGNDIDAVITDLRMPGIDGLALCKRVVERWPELPVIILTGFDTRENILAALRAGAFDVMSKTDDTAKLVDSLKRGIGRHRLRPPRSTRSSRNPNNPSDPKPRIVGRSAPLLEALEKAESAARLDAPVLLHGETGTGKELVAVHIHLRGPRQGEPLVPVDCAGLPHHLVEAELFGHVAGAFTDGRRDRAGLLKTAGGGTLLLDEVGELPFEAQSKLLRVLDSGTLRAVGADHQELVRARFVAATNRDLKAMVEAGDFRADLYYRLSAIEIWLPPLRGREDDVALLAAHFVEQLAREDNRMMPAISAGALDALARHTWPGNVRELRHVVQAACRAAWNSNSDVIKAPHIACHFGGRTGRPPRVSGSYPVSRPREPSERPATKTPCVRPLEEVELEEILKALQASGGSRTRAAQLLGLTRGALYGRLKKYGIDGASSPLAALAAGTKSTGQRRS